MAKLGALQSAKMYPLHRRALLEENITGVASLPCVETQRGQSHTGKADTALTVKGIGFANSVFYG